MSQYGGQYSLPRMLAKRLPGYLPTLILPVVGTAFAYYFIDKPERDHFKYIRGQTALYRDRKAPEGEDPWRY